MLALGGLSMSAADAATYIITRSGYDFKVNNSSKNYAIINDAIEYIQENSNGQPCTIQFGSGGDNVLDCWSMDFSGYWGAITLTGKITTSNTTWDVISLGNGISIDCQAELISTATSGNWALIHNGGNGTVKISGGTVQATTGKAIFNSSDGTVNITAGTVSSSTTGIVIDNGSNGSVTVSGGTVQATGAGGRVIYNHSTGTINISGGGVHATGSNGVAVWNNSFGTVNITGGEVHATATGGRAIFNLASGVLNISGNGAITSTTGITIDNGSNGKITVSGTLEITSKNTDPELGTIYLYDSNSTTALTINGGWIRNTEGGNAIRNNSKGNLTIANAIVSTTDGVAVWNDNTGNVSINTGSLVSAGGSGRAIFNTSTGAVTFSGGTVQVNAGHTVHNNSIGTVTVSGSSKILTNTGRVLHNNSSGVVNINGGLLSSTGSLGTAIWNNSTGTVTISGGEISSSYYQSAIYNNSTGTINITGGMILSKEGGAIYNVTTGTVSFSKGIAFAYGTAATNIINGAYTGTTANSLLIAWDKAANNVNYVGGTSTDIFKHPTTASAVWAKQESINGIFVSGGETSGFIPVEVTIGGMPTMYAVNFEGEDVSIPSQIVNHGDKADKPDDPVRTGYDFGGWFIDDGTFANEWDFDNPVTQNITLYAQWMEASGIARIESGTSIKVFPNPVKNELYIESGGLKFEKFEIYDVRGKKLLTLHSPISTNQIDISGLPAGIYVLKGTAGEGKVKSVRVVKE